MTHSKLADLGWSAFFTQQLDLSELSLTPARIAEVHRTRLHALTETGEVDLAPPLDQPETDLTVGDWVLTEGPRILRRLDRSTLLTRRAAGTEVAVQPIVANVDTIFIVSSCNDEFNVARLERYLALVAAGGCRAVIVLTKPDLADDADSFRDAALPLARDQTVVLVNARDPDSVAQLDDWCGAGQTVALLGSSGVGKTTLTNTLTGGEDATGAIREGDQRGRHTTTYRALRPLPSGGWIIDTPGMRTLRLSDVSEGIDATFAEVSDLIGQCKFRDCAHETEPGCAIQAAIAAGTLDAGRFRRWQKLKREDQRHTETVSEHRAKARSFGKMAREVMASKRKMRGMDEDD
ncbi:ribosome small subunit-dependent GTPase A [Frigidibacter sp. ROC022]|uniref:ribosome small subunit-dependent GTPase A n=1 Tax=Frigidibacter sp. ROC022 TaxID=2971796 RepID=UPI00215AE0B4|nr:ribosome small subunit-dependent GTPase A [Frigidibacter sp. ROC022]MCR8724273.1 ribosome small subunit-dependent GTPase A [Frigidibacter sp. ROC022]